MKLLVDIGNSRLKWALADGRRWQPGEAVMRNATLDGMLDSLWRDLAPPSSVIVANVAGAEAGQAISRWSYERWGMEPVMFGSQAETLGIINGYDDYTQFGCDRWAALIGARSLRSGDIGVIDCGTAITVDVVDASDRHRGGLIVPGLDLAQDSLLRNTVGVSARRREPSALLGRSTADCVTSGVFLVTAGGLQWATQRLETELNNRIHWFITGGDAPRLTVHMSRPPEHRPDLVLRGLASYADNAP
jgi:type III pantothenate kinase